MAHTHARVEAYPTSFLAFRKSCLFLLQLNPSCHCLCGRVRHKYRWQPPRVGLLVVVVAYQKVALVAELGLTL